MNNRNDCVILSKCIVLLYRESQLEVKTERSYDFVKTISDTIEISTLQIGFKNRKNVIDDLKTFVLDMCRKPTDHTYDETEFLQHLRLITEGDDNAYEAIRQSITEEMNQSNLKRMITSIKKTLNNYFREHTATKLIKRAARDLSYQRGTITNFNDYVQNLCNELSATVQMVTGKDNGVVRSMDFSDEDSINNVFEDVSSMNTDELVFVTGWRELNDALQGGPRPGDCLMVAALQHDYKTSFTLSLFAQIARLNKPKCKDLSKKPLCYRVSLEDPLRSNAQFLYQLQMYEETNQPVTVKGVPIVEMGKYIKSKLTATGYSVIFDEANPLVWGYQQLVNRLLELESLGYVIEVLCIDYLAKMLPHGQQFGAIGDDMLDLLSKIRAYCASRNILLITPHQLNTEAKSLVSNYPNEQFLQRIKGGGFFEKSKGLDRIYDIGLLIHRCEVEGNSFLHVVVDKHRFPSVVDSSLKSFFLPMPKNMMPIPSNLRDENYKVTRKLPKFTNSDSSYF